MEKVTTQTELKQVVKTILSQQTVKNLTFIGCGASMSELYAAYYYGQQNATEVGIYLLQANEFNYAKPAYFGENSVAIIASLGGTTKESVMAVQKAKQWGATVIALTYQEDSALTKEADYTLVHKFFESYAAKASKQKVALGFTVELLYALEKTPLYREMLAGLEAVDEIANTAAANTENEALQFAENYKDVSTIHVLASGANYGVAYSTGMFLFMEMQWINGVVLDSGEFFHGPFELAVKNAPYLLFMSDGQTRHLDARALEFLQRFSTKYTVIDAKDYWLDSKIDKQVVDYFDPMVLTAVMRGFAEKLGELRKHPLSKRRYMWKLENY